MSFAGTRAVHKPTSPIWRLKTSTGPTALLLMPAEKPELGHLFISVRRLKQSYVRFRARDFCYRRLPGCRPSIVQKSSSAVALVWASWAYRCILTAMPGRSGRRAAVTRSDLHKKPLGTTAKPFIGPTHARRKSDCLRWKAMKSKTWKAALFHCPRPCQSPKETVKPFRPLAKRLELYARPRACCVLALSSRRWPVGVGTVKKPRFRGS